MQICSEETYSIMFKDYPDILDVKQVSKLLDISTKTVYKLIKEGNITSLRFGREFKIPKATLLNYTNTFGKSSG